MTFDTNTILIIAGGLAALLILILLLRPRKKHRRVERRAEGESPYVASTDRPYMRAAEPAPQPLPQPPPPPPPVPVQRSADGPQGHGIADEVATAATDVAGEVLGVGARAELPGAIANPDELTLLKGVGPKFAARLNELGIARYDQLAALSANAAEMLDEKLGPFRGRLARDRIVEQASYLARGDRDGFEAQFGKLGGGDAGPVPTIRG